MNVQARKNPAELIEENILLKQRIQELEQSELKRKSSLQESEERYRSLVDNIDFGINLIDKDFKIMMTNAVTGKQFNKSAGELVGKYCFKEFEKRDTVCQHCPGVQAMATGQPHQVDTEGVRDNGSHFGARIQAFPLFYPDGTTKGFTETIEDITERKRVEEALSESESLYRNLFKNASIGMFQSNLEGRPLLVNKALASMFGFESPDEMIATVTDTVTHLYTDPESRAELLAALDQQDWYYTEKPYYRKDGSIIITKATVRKVFKKNTTTAYLEGIVEDITERKRAEEALIKSERELRIKAQNLTEVNTTMKVLLNIMEKDQEELKERFLDNIKAQVLPYLEKLKNTPLNDVQNGFVQMAEAHLNEIASPFVQKLTSNYLNLTKKEIQIAALVKEGKTSKEIAGLLNAKQRVIDFHRENIRKKLGLNNKKGNLAILLRSFS